MDSIIRITKDGKYAGHIVVVDDEVFIKNILGGLEKDPCAYNEIIEALAKDGCIFHITAQKIESLFDEFPLAKKEAA